MERLTYKVLREYLNTLTDNQLNKDVTIHVGAVDEFYKAFNVAISNNSTDILDEDHPFIMC